MNAIQSLLADHQLIRKVLEGFTLDNPRYPQILKTLQRAVVGHAWFEDTLFMPAFQNEPLLEKRFVAEMYQEHDDMDHYLKLLRQHADVRSREAQAYALQMRVLLETHLRKEEDAFFPTVEHILDSEGLNRLGDEMERRKTEIRDIVGRL
jgi:hemerythrin-like domain-containing protein